MSHHSDASNSKKNIAKDDALTILQVLRHPEYNKAAIAVVAVMVAQQLSGMLLPNSSNLSD
jgi:hypothetical protein